MYEKPNFVAHPVPLGTSCCFPRPTTDFDIWNPGASYEWDCGPGEIRI